MYRRPEVWRGCSHSASEKTAKCMGQHQPSAARGARHETNCVHLNSVHSPPKKELWISSITLTLLRLSIVDDKPLIVLAVCGWNTFYVPHFHCFKQTYMMAYIHCVIYVHVKGNQQQKISARRDKPTICFISTIVGVWNSKVLYPSAPLPI